MVKSQNTLGRGSVRYIVFRSGSSWYAVGLEFNIVESGDTPREAMLLLFEALQGYLTSARKLKLRPTVLNQKSDPEYEKLWASLQNPKKDEKSSNEVFTFGSLNLSSRIPVAV